MIPKPPHLGPSYAELFANASVVAAHRYRPPYPPVTFDVLQELMAGKRGPVLDIGCGRGDLTLGLAKLASRVDAVDPSAAMLEEARRRAGARHPNVRWVHAGMEEAPLQGPYALVTAGASLHWTDWEVTLPRLAEVLAPGARLAIVARRFSKPSWEEALSEIVPRYSTNQEYEPYDLVEELTRRGLFDLVGRQDVSMVPFLQTVDGYVESFHSANGFSRDRMAPDRRGDSTTRFASSSGPTRAMAPSR